MSTGLSLRYFRKTQQCLRPRQHCDHERRTDRAWVGRDTAFAAAAQNRFQHNTYYVGDPAGLFWQWQEMRRGPLWQSKGQDTTGKRLFTLVCTAERRSPFGRYRPSAPRPA